MLVLEVRSGQLSLVGDVSCLPVNEIFDSFSVVRKDVIKSKCVCKGSTKEHH